MMKIVLACLVAVLLMSGMTGCATPVSDEPAEVLSPGALKRFLSNARDPRRFWLTEYRSETGPFFANAFRVHPDQMAMLPFEPGEQPMPVIEVKSRHGDTVSALIDTSSEKSWIDIEQAPLFDLVPLGPTPYQYVPDHIEDAIPGYACAGTTIELDDLNIETPVFYARAARGLLWPLSRHPARTEIRAVLGGQFLQAFSYVRFDFEPRRMLFSSSRPYVGNRDLLLAETELTWDRGMLAVKGVMHGTERTFILDTAGDYELVMDQPESGVVRQLQVDDLVFRNVQVETARHFSLGYRDTPRIGLRLLSQFALVIDTREGRLLFERPVKP